MNKIDHYDKDVDYNKLITLHSNPEEYREVSNDEKSFSQRLGEANVMPTGMLDPISDTDLAIISMLKEDHEIEDKN